MKEVLPKLKRLYKEYESFTEENGLDNLILKIREDKNLKSLSQLTGLTAICNGEYQGMNAVLSIDFINGREKDITPELYILKFAEDSYPSDLAAIREGGRIEKNVLNGIHKMKFNFADVKNGVLEYIKKAPSYIDIFEQLTREAEKRKKKENSLFHKIFKK